MQLHLRRPHARELRPSLRRARHQGFLEPLAHQPLLVVSGPRLYAVRCSGYKGTLVRKQVHGFVSRFRADIRIDGPLARPARAVSRVRAIPRGPPYWARSVRTVEQEVQGSRRDRALSRRQCAPDFPSGLFRIPDLLGAPRVEVSGLASHTSRTPIPPWCGAAPPVDLMSLRPGLYDWLTACILVC